MPAFIDLNHATIQYRSKVSWWSALAGHKPATHTALQDVTLTVNQGSHIVIFGGPGAGKTTLLKAVAGALEPVSGQVIVNGQVPDIKSLASGFVSPHERQLGADTVYERLFSLKPDSVAINNLADKYSFSGVLNRPINKLSASEKLHVNLVEAILTDAPVILFDDVADELNPAEVKSWLEQDLSDRTVIITTRNAATAENLDLPLAMLRDGKLLHAGSRDSLAKAAACPQTVEVLMEGVRYDTFRNLKNHKGVVEVKLVPSNSIRGQKLIITARSARHLPGIYDLITQAPVIEVNEVPPSIEEIVNKI